MTLTSGLRLNPVRRTTAAAFGFLTVATSMTLAAPAQAAPGDKAGVVRTLAARVGATIGAASSCQGVARARIQTVIGKFATVIEAAAANEAERINIVQQLDRSVADGRRGLTNAQLDCTATERQFADLERSIGIGTAGDPALQVWQVAATPAASAPPVTQTSAIPSPSTEAVRGVSDREIRFGIAAPFSGASKELGRQLKLGIETAFNRTNDAGGVAGRMLRLIAADDGYEPAQTPAAMAQLTDKEQVFGIIGNVGTATAAAALPYVLDRRMLFFGAFTGAPILRRDPPDRYVFNYRASYAEETEATVHYLVKVRRLQPRQIAVFAQQDGYGEAGYAGVVKAMRALGAGDTVALRLGYKRNTVDVAEAVSQLRAHKGVIKAIIMVGTYRAAAKFIEKTRELNPATIYTNVSFTGSTALADELKLLGPQYTKGVIVTQVVPAVDGYSSAILEYKTALAKYFPGEAPDYVSLEGYIEANILIQALKQTGQQLDTERLVDSLETMRGLDLGIGATLNFGRTEHQASHKVWGTMLDENGRYQAIDFD
jgi:ABC-type branched-subunit amino acid transport system substrate-binding protein